MAEDKQKIHAMMIFEIIGRPAQHIVSSLNSIIDQLSAEEGVKVGSRDVKEPKKLDEKGGIAKASEEGFKIEENEFYMTFADVELDADNIFVLANLMFKYMPAHIDVISPEKISVSNGEWGEVLSVLVQKLHAYDEVARVLQVEKTALQSQLSSMLQEKSKANSEIKKVEEKPKEAKKKAVKDSAKKTKKSVEKK